MRDGIAHSRIDARGARVVPRRRLPVSGVDSTQIKTHCGSFAGVAAHQEGELRSSGVRPKKTGNGALRFSIDGASAIEFAGECTTRSVVAASWLRVRYRDHEGERSEEMHGVLVCAVRVSALTHCSETSGTCSERVSTPIEIHYDENN